MLCRHSSQSKANQAVVKAIQTHICGEKKYKALHLCLINFMHLNQGSLSFFAKSITCILVVSVRTVSRFLLAPEYAVSVDYDTP